jgi:TusA-related sulfurtransferase
MTLKEIDRLQRGEVSVCVDNDASRENVVRAATAKGWQVKEIVEEKDASYTINLAKT